MQSGPSQTICASRYDNKQRPGGAHATQATAAGQLGRGCLANAGRLEGATSLDGTRGPIPRNTSSGGAAGAAGTETGWRDWATTNRGAHAANGNTTFAVIDPMEAGRETFLPVGALPAFIAAMPTQPGAAAHPYQVGGPRVGHQADDPAFHVRRPDGRRQARTIAGPHSAIVPAGLAGTIECHGEARDSQVGELMLNPTFAECIEARFDLQLRRYRDALLRYYVSANTDDFVTRLQPILASLRRRGDLRLAFTKMWGYAFAAVQAECLPDGEFGLVAAAAAPIVEAAGAHAVFDAGADAGPWDALLVDQRFSQEDLTFWVEAVGPYPRYTYRSADGASTLAAFMPSMPGGVVRYHVPAGHPAGWGWAERAELPSFAHYARQITRWARVLDAQDEAMLAFELASNLCLGYVAHIGAGRGAAPTVTAGGTPIALTAALQVRGVPVPAPDYARLALHPVMPRVATRAGAPALGSSHAYAATRAAVQISNALAYGTSHALALLGITGRALMAGVGRASDIILQHALGGAAPGYFPGDVPLIACMTAHIAWECLGVPLTIQNARYSCVANDASLIDGGDNLAHIYGKWVPNPVRTVHMLSRLRAIPPTCQLPLAGSTWTRPASAPAPAGRAVAWGITCTLPSFTRAADYASVMDSASVSAWTYSSAIAYYSSSGGLQAANNRDSTDILYTSPALRLTDVRQLHVANEPAPLQHLPLEGSTRWFSHSRMAPASVRIIPRPGTDFDWGSQLLPLLVVEAHGAPTTPWAAPSSALARAALRAAGMQAGPDPAAATTVHTARPVSPPPMGTATAAADAPAPPAAVAEPPVPAPATTAEQHGAGHNAAVSYADALRAPAVGARPATPARMSASAREAREAELAAWQRGWAYARRRGPDDDDAPAPAAAASPRANNSADARDVKGVGADELRMHPDEPAGRRVRAARTARDREMASYRTAPAKPATWLDGGIVPLMPASSVRAAWLPAWARGGVAATPGRVRAIDEWAASGLVSPALLAAWHSAYAPELTTPDDRHALGQTKMTAGLPQRGATRPERPGSSLGTPAGRASFVRKGRSAARAATAAMFPAPGGMEDALLRARLYDVLATVEYDFRARDLARANAALDELFRGLGSTNETQATMYAAFCATSPYAPRIMAWAREARVLALDRHASVKAWKAVTAHVHATGCDPAGRPLSIDEARHWTYLQGFAGRDGMASDWTAERELRTTPHWSKVAPDGDSPNAAWTSEAYTAAFRAALDDVFGRMYRNGMVIDRTSTDFWADRHQWAAHGSAARIPVPTPLPRSVRERLHKGALFETLDDAWLDRVIDGTPHMAATEAEKYENGTNRALFAVLSDHYAVHSYVLTYMERALADSGVTDLGLGGAAEAFAQAERLRALQSARRERGQTAFMYDYANQNGQESPWEQQEVMAAALRAMKAGGLTGPGAQSYARACKWVEDSFNNMTLASTGQPVLYGLFSGLRGTSWINTFVNYAWFRVGRQAAAAMTGRDPIVSSVHNGDDAWAIATDHAGMVAFKRCMDAMGLAAQDSKCMAGAQRGEFLRLLYDADSGVVYGHPNRALASLISPSFQTQHWADPFDKACALTELASTMERRGSHASSLRLLVANVLKRTCVYRTQDGGRAVRIEEAERVTVGGDQPPPTTTRRRVTRHLPAFASKALARRASRRLPARFRDAVAKTVSTLAAENWATCVDGRGAKYVDSDDYLRWAASATAPAAAAPTPAAAVSEGQLEAAHHAAVSALASDPAVVLAVQAAAARVDGTRTGPGTFGHAAIYKRCAELAGGHAALRASLGGTAVGRALQGARADIATLAAAVGHEIDAGRDPLAFTRQHVGTARQLAPEWRSTAAWATAWACAGAASPAAYHHAATRVFPLVARDILNGAAGVIAAY